MTTSAAPRVEPRDRLSRQRVLGAALAQADSVGLESVSMRKLADALHVAPMALYRHVASREDLVDGLVDLGQGRPDAPPVGDRAHGVADEPGSGESPAP